jgi:predicted transcriptional regulator
MREIGENHTNITEILKKLNLEEKIPEATLRFNAKKLKELGLIRFGDRFNKGEIAELTPLGLVLYEILNGELKSLKSNTLFYKIKKINREEE